MSPVVSNSSISDLARNTCDFVPEDANYEGEFYPDIAEVEEWEKGPDQEYNGEWRYVNLGPSEVKKRLETEEDPEEKAALMIAFDFWGRKGGYAFEMEAGSVDRGEPREANVINSIRDALGGERVSHVSVLGSLSRQFSGVSSEGGGKFLGLDVIDYDFILDEMETDGTPEGEWF